MRLQQLIDAMEMIAPTRFAESWDNVGLLAGDPAQEISRAMLTIDYTREVAEEARTGECDCVIAYHPPIFEAMKRVCAPSLVFDAIRRGVAVYSPHTALDIADGGTNDMLAEVLGLNAERTGPLRPSPTKPNSLKLVTFVPADALEKVSAALFEAGAGRIGNYTRCSFRGEGTGTFFGEAGANPAVGQAGKLETAPEVRLETLVPLDKLAAVVMALRASHPYEEPAFDLLQLHAEPAGRGMGRIGDLSATVDRGQIIERIKRGLGLAQVLIAGPTAGPARRLACCAGACGDLLNDALAQGADVYLTGEMRHHDALKAAQRGMTVVCALHSNSERKVLGRLKDRLVAMLPELGLMIAKADRDPFEIR